MTPRDQIRAGTNGLPLGPAPAEQIIIWIIAGGVLIAIACRKGSQ